MAIEYGFNERMAMSEGVCVSADVKTVLLENIPGSLAIHKSHLKNDKAGVDWWVEMNHGRFLAVDAKVRENDWALKKPDEDDLALETWSVVESKISGWTRDENKRCDYILWLWKDTGRFCLVPFPMLCSVFNENWTAWSGKYKTCRQKTLYDNGRSYHSECVFVPRREVWASIYKKYGGNVRR